MMLIYIKFTSMFNFGRFVTVRDEDRRPDEKVTRGRLARGGSAPTSAHPDTRDREKSFFLSDRDASSQSYILP
jgi:hypothetical protein